MPCPPPMHSVTTPRRMPSRRIAWSRRVVSTAPVAPIGWPCAMAPPSTLTTSSGRPSSRWRRRAAMAAKASLISTRSMSPTRPAGALQRLADGRHRAEAEHAGLDRADPVGDQPRHRLEALALGQAAIGDDHRRGAAVQAGRVAGRDRAVLAEGRLQLGQALEPWYRAGCARRGRSRSAPCGPSPRWRRSRLELARRLGGGEALLRAHGPAVLVLAGDLRILGTRSSVCQPECSPEKASFRPSRSMLS